MIGVMLNEEELFSTSMLESIRDSLTINDLTVFREFVGGTHKLLDPFLEELNDEILLHSKVVAIKQDNGSVQDDYSDNTFPDILSSFEEEQFGNIFDNNIIGDIQHPFDNKIGGFITSGRSRRRIRPFGPPYKESANFFRNRLWERPLPKTRPIAENVPKLDLSQKTYQKLDLSQKTYQKLDQSQKTYQKLYIDLSQKQ